jgi:hypothetical protein
MLVIIAGSRSISTMAALESAIARSGFPITGILTGNSRGVDTLALEWGRAHGVDVEVMAPEWSRYGGRAEEQRNRRMIARADACVAVWDGFSRGTKALVELVEKTGLGLLVYRCNPQHATEGATTRVVAAISR